MAEEESKKVETQTPAETQAPPPAPAPEPAEAPKDVAEEKSVIPTPPAEEKPDESKAVAVVESNFSVLFIYLFVFLFELYY